MESREKALREALAKNAEETERWQCYKAEQQQAMTNMNTFLSKRRIEVMVPIGSVALMPGHLMHTNEVLVAHYQGYFTECSAHTAIEICEMRTKKADEQLKKLETEAELWRNKLEKPYKEGAMPTEGQEEIIEEYDEEKERKWREEHRKRVKEEKLLTMQKEREARALQEEPPKEKSVEDIFKMLDEAELREELEEELEALEVEEVNDDTLQKLMSGEIQLKEKRRVAHNLQEVAEDNAPAEEPSKPSSGSVVKKADLEPPPPANNNSRPNPDIPQEQGGEYESCSSDDEEEVRFIKEQAQFLPPSDQLGFYEYQIEIAKQKLCKLPAAKEPGDFKDKMKLYAIIEQLEFLIEDLEATLADDKDEEQEQEGEAELPNTVTGQGSKTQAPNKRNGQKRSISFALEDQTLEFRQNETVAHMLPNSLGNGKAKRDIITLDDPSLGPRAASPEKVSATVTAVDRKQKILEKVEKNREYQSLNNLEMVNQIMDEMDGKAKTLEIFFQHSQQEGYSGQSTQDNASGDDFVPGSPADCYKLCGLDSATRPETNLLFLHGYEEESRVKPSILREADRQYAYEDPRAEFSTPKSDPEDTGEEQDIPKVPVKPILRNKSAVNKETHLVDPLEEQENQPRNANLKINKKKKKKPKQTGEVDDEYMTAYYKVMSDVSEKQVTEPEPLPKEKFIDANAPKKRISRFKQMRQTGGEETAANI